MHFFEWRADECRPPAPLPVSRLRRPHRLLLALAATLLRGMLGTLTGFQRRPALGQMRVDRRQPVPPFARDLPVRQAHQLAR